MQTQTRQDELARLEDIANVVRQRTMHAFQSAGGGHVGGSLSAADVLTALYFAVMRTDAKNPRWPGRDRFVLSKGHASGALCATLATAGFFPVSMLDTFNHLDSPFSMHPDMRKIAGVDMSTGALGHGLSVGIGMALGARVQGEDFRVFVLMGDGELCEGTVWEAAMAAGHFGVDRLIAIVDRNRFSMDGPTAEIMNVEPLADKWRSFGWTVHEIDGHNMDQIVSTLRAAPVVAGRPTVVIAHTVKGKGFSLAENRYEWHYQAITPEIGQKAIAELEAARRSK